MLNIVIPMAGRGSRFANAGFTLPKPLIPIHGHPMIEYATAAITPACEHRFVYICQKEHLEKYRLAEELERIAPGCVIVTVDHITEGAACTVLLTEPYINTSDPLMIANSDQYIDTDINAYLSRMQQNDGLIMTLCSDDPKWSYVRCDAAGYVDLVREKEVISHEATVGIYNYRHGADFVKAAHSMIKKDIRVNGEFYVAPAYNEMIACGAKVICHNIGEKMYGLGIPEDMAAFRDAPISRHVFEEK